MLDNLSLVCQLKFPAGFAEYKAIPYRIRNRGLAQEIDRSLAGGNEQQPNYTINIFSLGCRRAGDLHCCEARSFDPSHYILFEDPRLNVGSCWFMNGIRFEMAVPVERATYQPRSKGQIMAKNDVFQPPARVLNLIF